MGRGLYANIHAKRKRGEKMRKKGAKGAPTAAQFARAAQTVKKKRGFSKKTEDITNGKKSKKGSKAVSQSITIA